MSLQKFTHSLLNKYKYIKYIKMSFGSYFYFPKGFSGGLQFYESFRQDKQKETTDRTVKDEGLQSL